MSTPQIVTVCVVGMVVMLIGLVWWAVRAAPVLCDDCQEFVPAAAWPTHVCRAGTGAAAEAAPDSAVSGVHLPTPDTRRLHPSSGVSSADLRLDEDNTAWLHSLRDDGPEGGVE